MYLGLTLVLVFAFSLSLLLTFRTSNSVAQDAMCRDLYFVFARGSGAERMNSAEWDSFSRYATKVADSLSLSYRMTDLAYPAVTVLKPSHAIGAFVSSGDGFAFGRSVKDGQARLAGLHASMAWRCPNTKWVLAGYSQGAMVVSGAVKNFKPEELLYVALFGDPELDLPEGRGPFPEACRGEKLSPYRRRAPECRTSSGVLGARRPYEAAGYEGKYGLWCNRDDFICGSSRNLLRNDGHLRYGRDGAFFEAMLKVKSMLNKEKIDGMTGTDLEIGADPGASKVPSADVFASLGLDEVRIKPRTWVDFDAGLSFSAQSRILSYY